MQQPNFVDMLRQLAQASMRGQLAAMPSPPTQLLAGTPPSSPNGRPIQGPGGGLDDLIPTTIDGRQAAALSDGEFVIPADVVSMLGDGSSNAGSRRLYDLVKEIRKNKTGTQQQAGPIDFAEMYERIMR